jgi:hypothetical protein
VTEALSKQRSALTGSSQLNQSTDVTGKRKMNFSITQSQFNAMQDQVRQKLGMTMPMLGGHA